MSDLLTRLRIEGDAAGAVRAGTQAENALKGVRQAAGTASPALDGVRRSSTAAAQGLERSAAGADKFERSSRMASRAGMLLGTALTAVATGAFAREITQAQLAAVGLSTGLNAATGSAAAGARELAWVREEADRLGLVAQDSARSMLNLAASTRGTELAGQATRDIWLSVNEAGLVLGRTNEQIGRGFTAIEQIAGKGIVSMEEVRQQLAEAIPGAVQIAARAMDMTTAEFNKVVAAGDLLATDFLPRFAAQLREEYGPAINDYLTSPMGLARAEMARWETQLLDLQAAAGGGFLEGMTEGLGRLNAELGDPEALERAEALGRVLGESLGFAADTAVVLADNIDLITTAATTLGGVALARYLAGVTLEARAAGGALIAKAAAANGAAASLTNLSRASVLARGAMGGLLTLVGGPLGAALLAAGGAVWYLTQAQAAAQRETEATNASIAEQARELERTRTAQSVLGGESARLADAQDVAAVAAANLTGEADKLADAHYRAAAAAKAQYIEELRLKTLTAADNAQEAVENFNQVRANAERVTRGPRGEPGAGAAAAGMAMAGIDTRQQAAQAALASPEYDALVTAEANARELSAQLDAALSETWTLDDWIEENGGSGSGGGGGGGSGRSRRDRGEALAHDLALEAEGLRAHAAAAAEGEAALEAWRIAEAGRQAVARLGPEASDAQATAIRAQAEEVERLAIAQERISAAWDFTRLAEQDIAAMDRRRVALAGGREALEAWRVEEAALAVLADQRLTTLDGLTAAEREAVATAMDAARAKEAQAIATEKAEAAAGAIEDLDRRIAAEARRTAGLTQGAAAEAEYARAEFIRQAVERAGLEVTDAAAQAIMDKAAALFQLTAAAEAAIGAFGMERELRLAQMSNRERQIALRTEQLIYEIIAAQGKAAAGTAEAQARARAEAEAWAADWADAAGELKTTLRDTFIESGDLAFEEMGDALERELRRAVYDALLAEPISILVDAAFGGLEGMLGHLGLAPGGAQAGGGGLLAGLLKPGGLLGNAAAGGMMGAGMGLGSGNGLLDAGLSIGGSWLGGMASGAVAGMVGGSMGAALGSVMGPLGALAGMALGSLFKDEKRPMARTDVVARDGKFTVAGTDAADGGPKDQTAKLGAAIADSLNAAAALLGVDFDKIEGLWTTAGYVTGGNYKGLKREGYFGGDVTGPIDDYGDVTRDRSGHLLANGVSFTGVGDAEALAESVVRETILRAIAAGATDLSDAEKRLVQATATLEEAIEVIARSRTFTQGIDDAIQQILDPAGFERDQALRAIEDTYTALREEALALIEAGLITGDVLTKLEELRDLQRDAVLNGQTPGGADPFQAVAGRLQSWLDALEVSDVAPGSPAEQRRLAQAQYDRQLALAQGGDADALNSISQYADRLLKADRAVTGSAPDRARLFGDVTNDIRALIGLDPTNPLDGLAEPIVAAVGDSTTALADLLATLAPETAGPIIAQLMQRPDWAAALLGASEPVPSALAALAAQIAGQPPEIAGPIVTELLKAGGWAQVQAQHLAVLPPSLDQLAAALAGVAPGTAGPIIAAVLATPTWAEIANAYLGALPPSLETLAALTAGQPAAVAGPIIAALAATPAWTQTVIAHMASVAPSVDLLAEIMKAQPEAITAPLIQALAATPAWGALAAERLAELPASMVLLAALLEAQPSAITGPLLAALGARPDWAELLIEQAGALPPSIQLLTAILEAQPSAITAPLLTALAQSPAWASIMTAHLAQLPASLGLLQALAQAQPAAITGPLLAALAAEPAWAAVLSQVLGVDVAGGLDGVSAQLGALGLGVDGLSAVLALLMERLNDPLISVPDPGATPVPIGGGGGGGGGGLNPPTAPFEPPVMDWWRDVEFRLNDDLLKPISLMNPVMERGLNAMQTEFRTGLDALRLDLDRGLGGLARATGQGLTDLRGVQERQLNAIQDQHRDLRLNAATFQARS